PARRPRSDHRDRARRVEGPRRHPLLRRGSDRGRARSAGHDGLAHPRLRRGGDPRRPAHADPAAPPRRRQEGGPHPRRERGPVPAPRRGGRRPGDPGMMESAAPSIRIPVPRPLARIAEKVYEGVRLDEDEAMQVFRSRDLITLGHLANVVRERLHGDRTYYNRNFHLNLTNVCEASCRFCAFSRLEEGMPLAKTFTVEEAIAWVKEHLENDPTEVHIVNGLHPGLPFEYYEEVLRGIRAVAPKLHIKGFTAVEVHYYAEKYGMTYEEVLRRLVDAGLGSMPGGGAEIFAPR